MRKDIEPPTTNSERVTYKNIRIPLSTDDALGALLRVKPTKDMPRPGATKKKPVAKKKR